MTKKDSADRVDFAIKLPGLNQDKNDVVWIPIDAKFPQEDYERLLEAQEAADPDLTKRMQKQLEMRIKSEARTIRDKYINPPNTTDFAIMFIPSESVYYETIAEKNYLGQPSRIYEYARNNQVVPVSPNTFYAFLQVVVMGIRNLDIMKSAKKLQEELVKIERNFKFFYSKYEEIGSCIEKAQGAYKIGDTHIKRFKDNIDQAQDGGV